MNGKIAMIENGKSNDADVMRALLGGLKDLRRLMSTEAAPTEMVLGAAFAEDPKAQALMRAIEAYNAGFEAEGQSYRVDSARVVLALELISGAWHGGGARAEYRFEIAVRKDLIFWPFYCRTWWAQLITRGATSELVESVGPFSSRNQAQVFGWEWQRKLT